MRRCPMLVRRSSALMLALAAFIPAGAQAQAPAPAQEADEPESRPITQDLFTRYRLSERYTTAFETGDDGSIGQAKVSARETIQETINPAPGNPQDSSARAKPRAETQRPTVYQQHQVTYSDRAAEISGLGQVRSVLRRYDEVAVTQDPSKPPERHPIEGLTVWYRPQPPDLPQVICLTPERLMTESEYKFVAVQLFLPNLSAALPPTALRIGDAWTLSKQGAKLLIGADAVTQGGLTGKLSEIRNDPKGSDRDRVAILDITGHVIAQVGFSPVNTRFRARIEFAFSLPRADDPAAVRRDQTTIDARGAIVGVRMVQIGEVQPGQISTDRRSRTLRRELVLDRQLANAGEPLDLPRGELPKPTPENSWLTFIDPQKRFAFRHPQELHHPQDYNFPSTETANRVELIHSYRSGGADRVVVDVSPEAKVKPEDFVASVLKEGKSRDLKILRGPSDWLPDDDWPGMRVYRTENAFVLSGRSARSVERVHSDGYVVHFPGREGSLTVQATTAQDPPIQLRRDVEAMLKTFEWTASRGDR